MATAGYPGTFPGITATISARSIGAVEKTNANARGFPGIFPGITATVGSMTIGAVQRPQDISGTLTTTLGALTLVATGTVTTPASGGGSQSAAPLESTYRQIPQRIAGALAISRGKTSIVCHGSPVVFALATAMGHTTANAQATLIQQAPSRSLGYTVAMSSYALRIAPRNEMRTRSTSATFAIG